MLRLCRWPQTSHIQLYMKRLLVCAHCPNPEEYNAPLVVTQEAYQSMFVPSWEPYRETSDVLLTRTWCFIHLKILRWPQASHIQPQRILLSWFAICVPAQWVATYDPALIRCIRYVVMCAGTAASHGPLRDNQFFPLHPTSSLSWLSPHYDKANPNFNYQLNMTSLLTILVATIALASFAFTQVSPCYNHYEEDYQASPYCLSRWHHWSQGRSR